MTLYIDLNTNKTIKTFRRLINKKVYDHCIIKGMPYIVLSVKTYYENHGYTRTIGIKSFPNNIINDKEQP